MVALYCGVGEGWDGMYCNVVDMKGHHYGGSVTTHKESLLFFLAGKREDRDREEQKFTNKPIWSTL